MADPDARRARFDRAVLPHLDRLLAFARRRAASDADAEDVVQDACVRAWLALDELRDDARALPWLFQIVRHVSARANEKHARRGGLAPEVPWDEAACARLASDAPDPLEQVIATAAGEEVARALRSLPDHYATAVELRDLEGLPCRDVAMVLGVPPGTVLSRVHRGRRLLAERIAAARATEVRGAADRRDAWTATDQVSARLRGEEAHS